MISKTELFERIGRAFPPVRWVAAFPYVYVDVVSETFSEAPDDRDEQLALALGMDLRGLRETTSRLFLRINPLRPEEESSGPPDEQNNPRGSFWLGALSTPGPDLLPQALPSGPRIVHFYGFKGGQGRSTTLALFARALSADGWRVLALDLDAEAPSLDVLFKIDVERPEHSFVGLRGGLDVKPLRVLGGERGGFVDLIAFSPADTEWAADAASLALEMALYPPGQAALAGRLSSVLAGYDVVLIDHRTGLAPTVLPWVDALPGALCVFARMDGQWTHSTEAVRSLWHHCVEPFGALLSLGPPGTSRNDEARAHRNEAASLLLGLAERQSTADAEVSEHDLVDERFVAVPFDNQVVGGKVPPPRELGGATVEALTELRQLLELHRPPVRETAALAPLAGDRSGGVGIETDALHTLLAENELDWVVGRKGIGKTWLLRTLHEQGRGEALLVPEVDEELVPAGIPARAQVVERFTSEANNKPRTFWWALVAAGLDVETTDRDALLDAFERALKLPDPSIQLDLIVQKRQQLGLPPKLLFIDGLEIAFPPDRTIDYIAELVRVIHTIRSTPLLRGALRLQAFVRTDLFRQPYENIEQLAQGRTLELSWSHRAALNLLVAKLISLPWYGETFPDAVRELKRLDDRLRRAEVEESVCEEALEQIFPEKSGHANVATRTFWRGWFCDDAGAGRPSAFPRLLVGFLSEVERLVREAPPLRPGLKDGRVSSWVMAEAHAAITRGPFLLSTLAELGWMVPKDTRAALPKVVRALNSESTPFNLAELLERVSDAERLQIEDVRLVLNQMLRLGLFVQIEQSPAEWRATRLYRTALQMKFRR